MTKVKRLTNLQLELLDLFSYELGEQELKEIQQLLINYLANKITNQMDALFEANNWGEEKINEWSKEHMRTKYEGQ